MNMVERVVNAWIKQIQRNEDAIMTEGAHDWWMRELERRLATVEGG